MEFHTLICDIYGLIFVFLKDHRINFKVEIKMFKVRFDNNFIFQIVELSILNLELFFECPVCVA